MAREKFSELPTVTNASLTDIVAAVQAGVSVKETLAQIITLGRDNTILNYAGNPQGNLAGTRYQLCWDTVDNLLYICTNSGVALTAVWALAGSLTIPVTLANGGTSKALTADNGGMVYSDSNSFEILPSTVTAGQIIRSGASAAPSWSAASYPSTVALNSMLYASPLNNVKGLASLNGALLTTNSGGVPTWVGPLLNGQIIIGATGLAPSLATLTAGTNISITNGANSITISSSGGAGFTWSEITGTSQSMLVDNGYISSNAGLVTLTLPVTAAIGDAIAVAGKGAGGWRVAQNASQTIHIGSSATTVGAGGSVSSTNRYDSMTIVCITANTEWTLLGAPQGTLTIV